jgi:hypothetical protein
LHNAYGWFERIERGRYRLTGLGAAALQDHDAVRYGGGAQRT